MTSHPGKCTYFKSLTKGVIGSPGPAAYSALNLKQLKKAPPAYSLGRKWENDLQSPFYLGYSYVTQGKQGKSIKKPTPGPGHCILKKYLKL